MKWDQSFTLQNVRIQLFEIATFRGPELGYILGKSDVRAYLISGGTEISDLPDVGFDSHLPKGWQA